METKEQFQKILEWMKQINRTMATKKDLLEVQEGLNGQMYLIERKLALCMDALDERFDSLTPTVSALIKRFKKSGKKSAN